MGFKVYVKSVYVHLWRKPIHFKSSQRVLENKNINGQSTTHIVHGPHHSTSPGCSALSRVQLHFPQLRTGKRLTPRDTFSHTNAGISQVTNSQVYLIHPIPTGRWAFHEP